MEEGRGGREQDGKGKIEQRRGKGGKKGNGIGEGGREEHGKRERGSICGKGREGGWERAVPNE
jgi:hypothetical protein